MEYKIIEHLDDSFEIFYPDGFEFLRITRTHNWYGKLKIKVFMENTLIFECHTTPFSRYAIIYQDLKDELVLTKHRFYYTLSPDLIRTQSGPFLKLKEGDSLFKNDELIGRIYFGNTFISLFPIKWKAVFDKDRIENLYGLILWAIKRPLSP